MSDRVFPIAVENVSSFLFALQGYDQLCRFLTSTFAGEFFETTVVLNSLALPVSWLLFGSTGGEPLARQAVSVCMCMYDLLEVYGAKSEPYPSIQWKQWLLVMATAVVRATLVSFVRCSVYSGDYPAPNDSLRLIASHSIHYSCAYSPCQS